jgi:hypothetical protein
MFENSLSRDLLNAEVEYRLSKVRDDLAGRRRRRGLLRSRRTGSAGAAEPR